MMDLDVKTASKAFIEVLREQVAELENLEATGASTPDTNGAVERNPGRDPKQTDSAATS